MLALARKKHSIPLRPCTATGHKSQINHTRSPLTLTEGELTRFCVSVATNTLSSTMTWRGIVTLTMSRGHTLSTRCTARLPGRPGAPAAGNYNSESSRPSSCKSSSSSIIIIIKKKLS